MRRFFGRDLAKGGLLGLALAVLLLLPAVAMAQNYAGQICWNLTVYQKDTQVLPVPMVVKLTFDVTFMGGSTYFLTGYAAPPGDNPFLVSGTAYAAGPYLYLNMFGSQDHRAYEPYLDSSHINGRLDIATLSGHVYDVGHDLDTSNYTTYMGHYSHSTLTPTACQ
jgi:hypothetical protein